MGKLHSLKRAITRNPEEFLAKETFYTKGRLALGAIKNKCGWVSVRMTKHNRFVKKVLRGLGYNVWTW